MKLFVAAGLLCVETAFSVGTHFMEGVGPAYCWGAVGTVLLTAIPGAAKVSQVIFDRVTTAYGEVVECDG